MSEEAVIRESIICQRIIEIASRIEVAEVMSIIFESENGESSLFISTFNIIMPLKAKISCRARTSIIAWRYRLLEIYVPHRKSI